MYSMIILYLIISLVSSVSQGLGGKYVANLVKANSYFQTEK